MRLVVDIGTIVNWGIAGWGAGLSSLLAYQQYRDRRARLRVTLNFGELEPIPNAPSKVQLFIHPVDDAEPHYLVLTATNTGQRAIVLDALGVLVPSGLYLPLAPSPNVAMPYLLPPDQACTSLWPVREISECLAKAGLQGTISLRGYYVDQRRHIHKAKPFEFKISD